VSSAFIRVQKIQEKGIRFDLFFKTNTLPRWLPAVLKNRSRFSGVWGGVGGLPAHTSPRIFSPFTILGKGGQGGWGRLNKAFVSIYFLEPIS
jgi:hypothetical protein